MSLSAVAAIISIAVSLAMGAQATWSTSLSALNQRVRNTIQQLAKTISSQLAAKRLDASKLTSLLNSQNQQALTTYLYNNPIISKSLNSLSADSASINTYSSQLTAIENEIADYKSQLNTLGYSQSHSGVSKERKKVNEIEASINDAQSRYDAVLSEMRSRNLGSSTNSTKPYTADISAATQNTKGGLK